MDLEATAFQRSSVPCRDAPRMSHQPRVTLARAVGTFGFMTVCSPFLIPSYRRAAALLRHLGDTHAFETVNNVQVADALNPAWLNDRFGTPSSFPVHHPRQVRTNVQQAPQNYAWQPPYQPGQRVPTRGRRPAAGLREGAANASPSPSGRSASQGSERATSTSRSPERRN